MRIFYWCVGLITSLCLSHASAQTLGMVSAVTAPEAITATGAIAPQATDVAVVPAPRLFPTALHLPQPGDTPEPLQIAVREHVPLNHGIQTISAEPTLFTQLFDPLAAYKMNEDDAMWLHFRVRTQDKPSPTGWILSLSKSYIDRIEFYYKDAQGRWQMQVAGDHLPHAQWPLRNLQPQFALPVMAQGEHDFYVKVKSAISLHFSVRLQRTDEVYLDAQNTMLWAGLLLGAALLMIAYSCVKALTLGQAVYGWYALFVVLSSLATVSHLGFSNRFFWPNATWWPEYSTYALIMAAITAQLQFSRTLLLTAVTPVWCQRMVTAVIAVSLLVTGLFFFTDRSVHRQICYAFVSIICLASIAIMVYRALRHSGYTAWLYILAYLPLLITALLASIDSFGLIPVNAIPFDATVYAQIFELVVLSIALQLHAKSLQTQVIRESVMAGIDPLTGFVTSRLFDETAEQLWDEGRQYRQDMVVAYVEAKSDTKQPVQQTVRLLRTVVRDNDIVAHVDDTLFAILQPGKSVGDELSSRLSRLVVLGQMANEGHSGTSPVNFRIVASSLASFTGSWQDLDHALVQKLKLSTGWERRRIRFVVKTNTEKFEALWMRAVEASAEPPAKAKKA